MPVYDFSDDQPEGTKDGTPELLGDDSKLEWTDLRGKTAEVPVTPTP